MGEAAELNEDEREGEVGGETIGAVVDAEDGG